MPHMPETSLVVTAFGLGVTVTATFALATPAASGPVEDGAMIPLVDLGAGSYLGAQGGLYPAGANTPPPAHLADAMTQAHAITPLNGDGMPDPNGLIGLIAIGMSNTNQEFGAFAHTEDGNAQRNARLVLVGTAVGGQDSTAVANPAGPYWSTVDSKLFQARITAEQVQVCWLKEAKAGPTGAFPIHAESLRDELKTIVQILRDRFPNLRLCYLSSRIFAGYATSGSNLEPFAYESGFSVKWLIEDQINGDPALNYGQLPGSIESPLLLWGPYLWADGATPNGNGTTWIPADFEQSGTDVHPAAPGEAKVAALLSSFFASDPTTQPWWWKQPDAQLISLTPLDDATVDAADPTTNFGATTTLRTRGGDDPARSYLRFNNAHADRPLVYAKMSLRVDGLMQGGGAKFEFTGDGWSQDTITWANAPAPIEPPIGDIPQGYSRGGYTATSLTNALSGAPEMTNFVLLGNNNTPERGYESMEASYAPRLVLTVLDECPTDVNGSGATDFADVLALLGEWGPCPGCESDLNGDTVVDFADVLVLLAGWGECR